MSYDLLISSILIVHGILYGGALGLALAEPGREASVSGIHNRDYVIMAGNWCAMTVALRDGLSNPAINQQSSPTISRYADTELSKIANSFLACSCTNLLCVC